MLRSMWRFAVVGVVVSADLGCWLALAGDRSAGWDAALPELVTAVAAWAVQLALGWFTVLIALVAIEPVAGRELTGYAACPPGVRRVLLLICGAVAVGAATAPVQAAEPPVPAHPTSSSQLRLDGLPLPDRTDDGSSTGGTGDRVDQHVVREGDSLWQVARAALVATEPTRAPTNVEIDRAWRAWYAANRARVGADPDLIHPGTDLRAPPGS